MPQQDAPRLSSSDGTCYRCDGHFTKSDIVEHLQSHLWKNERIAKEMGAKLGVQQNFHILVEGTGLSQYWLHLEARTSAALHRLDAFLRDIWLECCGHLSKFIIEGREYVSYDPKLDTFPGEEKLRRMTVHMDKVLRPGLTFHHEYDFGTTTYLTLHVLSERTAIKVRDPLRLLARNDDLNVRCAVCGKPATRVCGMCIYQDDYAAWYCDDEECQGQHKCSDPMATTDYFLPVANSPRVGQCGYTGWPLDDEGEE